MARHIELKFEELAEYKAKEFSRISEVFRKLKEALDHREAVFKAQMTDKID